MRNIHERPAPHAAVLDGLGPQIHDLEPLGPPQRVGPRTTVSMPEPGAGTSGHRDPWGGVLQCSVVDV
jgi:hypothetical protein